MAASGGWNRRGAKHVLEATNASENGKICIRVWHRRDTKQLLVAARSVDNKASTLSTVANEKKNTYQLFLLGGGKWRKSKSHAMSLGSTKAKTIRPQDLDFSVFVLYLLFRSPARPREKREKHKKQRRNEMRLAGAWLGRELAAFKRVDPELPPSLSPLFFHVFILFRAPSHPDGVSSLNYTTN